MTNDKKIRIYPKITTNLPPPTRPISFICVKFSNEFQHNIVTSECIHDDLNEFIVVDNRSDIFFQTLGQAMIAGISQAKNDLLVIVHEDVVLLPGWQAMFEKSLKELEKHDPDWLVVGLVGWDKNQNLVGHKSDPHRFRNTFGDKSFLEAARIDEQVFAIRKSKGLFPDTDLPSIHNIGRDIVWSGIKQGGATYVINAPPIHKYADVNGKLVFSTDDSEKIQNRQKRSYIHNKECSDEYIQHKWRGQTNVEKEMFDEKELTTQQMAQLNSPTILMGCGGSGTSLISVMASDVGLFIGNEKNSSGDYLEMVGAIYRAVFRKYRCPSKWQKSLIIPELRDSAIKMQKKASWPTRWGFNLPESLFILPELHAAFPKAKYVFLNRDPVTIALRESHMSARLDNEIGRTVLPIAYDFAKLPRETILTDNPTVRMARGIAYQIAQVSEFKSSVSDSCWHKIIFENLMIGSKEVLKKFAGFCGLEITSNNIFQAIDHKRDSGSIDGFSHDVIGRVEEILKSSRHTMGYL